MISAFGLAVDLALPIPELEPRASVTDQPFPPGPPLRVQLADAQELDAAWTGTNTPTVKTRAVVDGSTWTAERGRAGDLRMDHSLCRFHLDPTATLLRCAPREADHPGWRRLLLDTALVTVSLARGHDALHAGCVVAAHGAVAIAGETGVGKTTLLVELLRAGAGFLTDDVVVLDEADGVLALPGPPVANVPDPEAVNGLAERLHPLGGEWWVRIRRPHSSPTSIRVVLVLQPGDEQGGSPLVTRLHQPAAALLGHALQSGSEPLRRERRFARLARLADHAEVMAVKVDRSRSPEELAAGLIEAIPLLQP